MGGQGGGGSTRIAVISGIFLLIGAVITGLFSVAVALVPALTRSDPSPSSSVPRSPDVVASSSAVPPPSASVPLAVAPTRGSPGTPTVSVSRSFVAPGEEVVVSGRNFPASQQVTFVWQTGRSSGALPLGYGDVAADGSFTTRVTIRTDVCNGPAGSLYVSASQSYAAAEAPLRMTGASC